MNDSVYVSPNLITPNTPLIFNETLCDGCNRCLDVCRSDIMMPNPKHGKPPIVVFPDECWYCGCCVEQCPHFLIGAIKLLHPITQEVTWKRKETGELFRMCQANGLSPNKKPPVGGWDPGS